MKPVQHSLRAVWVGSIASCLFVALVSCAGVVPVKIFPSSPGPNWLPALSNQQIAMVQQEFALFVPEEFAPGTTPTNRERLDPDNFAPAQFFGPAVPQGFKPTPNGIMLETNGYDVSVPAQLPPEFTYFDPNGSAASITLGTVTFQPLNILRKAMGLPSDPNAPTMVFDLTRPTVDPTYVDTIMFSLRDQFATVMPEIANVDPRTCKMIIEPSIFFNKIGSNSSTYTGGLVSTIGGQSGPPTIYLSLFYINSQNQVSDWAEMLMDQSLNFYLVSIGRSNLIPIPAPFVAKADTTDRASSQLARLEDPFNLRSNTASRFGSPSPIHYQM